MNVHDLRTIESNLFKIRGVADDTVRPASNADLMKIAAGVNHLVLHHDSLWNGEDRILDVRFKLPILRRPLTATDKHLAVKWAMLHPRYWRIKLTLHLCDNNGNPYDEVEDIETNEALKLDNLNEFIRQQWLDIESSVNPKHIRGREWVATIINTNERKR